MRHSTFVLSLASAVFLASASAYSQNRIALTFDDLPVATYSQTPEPAAIAEQQAITGEMLSALRKHHAPATGFVNEVKVNTPGARDAYAAMLQAWLDAGMDLGCHGYSHLYLSDVTLQAYEDDFARGTVLTPLLMRQAGKTERYYRYPYNDTGDTLEKRNGFRAYLGTHQYQVAPMTLENDDWLYAALYDDALRRHDSAMAAKVREAYLAENEEKIAFVEQLAGREFHRAVPQIADLHVDRLNADMLDSLLAQFERHGYKFIALGDALADPAYATQDPYVGRAGISWLERWAPVLGVKDPFAGDGDPPKWALDAYKAMIAK
jgi:peptidoglycan/xylan/chitin deacetylase (PgdA/CDA1 family)